MTQLRFKVGGSHSWFFLSLLWLFLFVLLLLLWLLLLQGHATFHGVTKSSNSLIIWIRACGT
jgi:hypothetical protein